MVEAGAARIVLGNHEFNVGRVGNPDPERRWCRRLTTTRTGRNTRRSSTPSAPRAPCHAAWIEWFQDRPALARSRRVRVVHACWSPADMSTLGPWLTAADALTRDGAVRGSLETATHPVYAAVEVVLKGPGGSPRRGPVVPGRGWRRPATRARFRWWDADCDHAASWRRHPRRGGRRGRPAVRASSPTTRSATSCLPRTPRTSTVVFGHYWRGGAHRRCSARAWRASTDSAGNRGPLVAYRWSGAQTTLMG